MKRKKVVFALGGSVIVIAAIVIGVVLASVDRIVKTAVETLLPDMLKAPVTLASVDISPFSGKGELTGLVVGNPEGYKTDSAFRLEHVSVHIDLKSLTSDTIVIHDITVVGPGITYEVGLGNSNLTTLRDNVLSRLPAASDDESTADDGGESKNIHIKQFTLNDGTISVSAKVLAGQKVTLPLPPVSLTDIQTDSPEQAVAHVLGSVVNVVEQVVKASGALLGEVKDLATSAGNTLKDGATQAAGAVKNLFKKK